MASIKDQRVLAYLQKNSEWANSPAHKAPVEFVEMQAKGRASPDGMVFVLACCDPRVTPEEFMGMGPTSKAVVLRNAGGRVASAMNSLLILTAVGKEGRAGTIVVVHHTDCGIQSITDEGIRESLRRRAYTPADIKLVDESDYGCIGDPVETVKEDVALLVASAFFTGMEIVGMVQDTQSGLLDVVVAEGPRASL